MERMLTTEEAARRLGVKASTLYAYVSRGLLESHPDPARRGSLFDLDDIESLAERSRGGRQTATRLATVTTAVTQLDQRLGPIYRGRAATGLARSPASRRSPSCCGSPLVAGDWSAPDSGHARWTPRSSACAGRWSCAGRPIPFAPTCVPPRWPAPPAAPPPRSTDVVGPAPPGEAADASIAARLGGAPGSLRLGGAVRRRECRPRPPGGSRARHLDHGRAPRGIGALRSL